MKLLNDAPAAGILEEQRRRKEILFIVFNVNFIVEEQFGDRAKVGQSPLTVKRTPFICKALKDYALHLQWVQHIMCKWYLTWYHLSWPQQECLLRACGEADDGCVDGGGLSLCSLSQQIMCWSCHVLCETGIFCGITSLFSPPVLWLWYSQKKKRIR